MTKKKYTRSPKKSVHGHDFVVAVALAIVTICTLAGSDAFLSAPDSPSIAHANTSANPYRPVGTYVPPTYHVPSYASSYAPTFSPSHAYSSSLTPARITAIQRKLKTAKKSAAAVEKQILHGEDSVDALQKQIDNARGRKTDALEQEVMSMSDNLNRLGQHLADLNSQISMYELMLDPSKDHSR